MKHSGIAVAVAAGATVVALLGAVPASAGDAPTVSVTPASGPAGTTVTISGDGCPGGDVLFGILRPYDEATGSSWPIVVNQVFAEDDGGWSGEVVVPASSPFPDGDGGWVDTEVAPGDGYSASAICGTPSPETSFEYPRMPFEVTEGSTPTTTIPGPTTTTIPVWEPPAPTPPPATPISDDPPFTG